MPQDPHKRQQAVMKKRSKQKAAGKHKTRMPAFDSFTAQAIIRRAQTYPIFECLISSNWQKSNMDLIQILIARTQPDGAICFGSYLIDKLCLGVKNTLAKADVSLSTYETKVRTTTFRAGTPIACSPELAHQMIYASIDYAKQFGFSPEKDFATSQYLLAPRGELPETYNITFGKNGKPFFIAGPYDNAKEIIKQLEATAGLGNYDYVMPMGDF
jgi:hypothetical protein